MFEPLGRRLLLAAFSWPSDGALNVGADDLFIADGVKDGVAGLYVTQKQAGGLQTFYPDCTQLTLNLGDGNDRLMTTSAVSLAVFGGAGNDGVYAGAGTDTIFGEGGNDDLSGGSGADSVEGGGGNDSLYGGDGPDTLLGGNGDDHIWGNDGMPQGQIHPNDNDNISGGDGNDWVQGQFGTDDIAGATGNDDLQLGTEGGIIQGGAGDDSIRGGAGADNLIGNEGNDFFYTYDWGQDYAIRGGADFDTLVNYDQSDLQIPTSTKRFDSIEFINGL